METDTLCGATRKDGRPCAMKAGEDSYCLFHSPAAAERRKARRAQGGRNRATPRRLEKLVPSSLKPLLQPLMEAVGEVHDGTLDPRQASAMASLAGAIQRLYETATLTERVEALERGNNEYGHAG